MDAAEVHAFLSRLLYQRRSKFNPLWNSIIVASVHDGTPCALRLRLQRSRRSPPCRPRSFLGTVDKIGTAFTDDYLATGFGGHMAMPILRDKWRPDLGEGEARALLQDCMRVLFYRDCRTINKVRAASAPSGDGGQASAPLARSLAPHPPPDPTGQGHAGGGAHQRPVRSRHQVGLQGALRSALKSRLSRPRRDAVLRRAGLRGPERPADVGPRCSLRPASVPPVCGCKDTSVVNPSYRGFVLQRYLRQDARAVSREVPGSIA